MYNYGVYTYDFVSNNIYIALIGFSDVIMFVKQRSPEGHGISHTEAVHVN